MSGKYMKIREIGKGSYGKAMLVQHREDRKQYVMKMIDTSRMNAKERREAQNEVNVLSSIKHPYTVQYRENFMEGQQLCIVMDYCDGGDLYKHIEKVKRRGDFIPEATVLKWFTQATLALKYLHDKHILHRDLKTQNLFLTGNGRLRVGDFGISKVLESTGGLAMTQIGTPYYLSPEICQRKPYSWGTDVWSLGCVLYELCALRVPFEAPDLRQLCARICSWPAPSLPARYSQELRNLCNELLNRDVHKRISASEILQRPIVQREIKRMLEEEHKEQKRKEEAKQPAGSDKENAAPATPAAKKENAPPQSNQLPGTNANYDGKHRLPPSAREQREIQLKANAGATPWPGAGPPPRPGSAARVCEAPLQPQQPGQYYAAPNYRAPSPGPGPAYRQPSPNRDANANAGHLPGRAPGHSPFHHVPSPRRAVSPSAAYRAASPSAAYRAASPSAAYRAPSPAYRAGPDYGMFGAVPAGVRASPRQNARWMYGGGYN